MSTPRSASSSGGTTGGGGTGARFGGVVGVIYGFGASMGVPAGERCRLRIADSWGMPRSGGRTHQGVDILARGARRSSPSSTDGGCQDQHARRHTISLTGDDGHVLLRAPRRAGTVGRVVQGHGHRLRGRHGQRPGAPHLHFEIHPGGGAAVNPYPTVRPTADRSRCDGPCAGAAATLAGETRRLAVTCRPCSAATGVRPPPAVRRRVARDVAVRADGRPTDPPAQRPRRRARHGARSPCCARRAPTWVPVPEVSTPSTDPSCSARRSWSLGRVDGRDHRREDPPRRRVRRRARVLAAACGGALAALHTHRSVAVASLSSTDQLAQLPRGARQPRRARTRRSSSRSAGSRPTARRRADDASCTATSASAT